jgi:hypothetical protein
MSSGKSPAADGTTSSAGSSAECDSDHGTDTVGNHILLTGNSGRSTKAEHDLPLCTYSRSATMTRMNVNEAVCEALFASALQPSDTVPAETVAQAIGSTFRRLGAVGCSRQLAEEFGNHPEEAATRMRWIRQLAVDRLGEVYFPTATPTTATSAGTDLLPVRDAA